jgi:hypothetical protein
MGAIGGGLDSHHQESYRAGRGPVMRGLPRAVKDALHKARDAALLAVEIYNKPAVSFKSGGYVTLMVIAWTSLFHAVFLRRKVKPYYRNPNGRYVRVDGDYRHWELGECLKEYYGTNTNDPVRKNLEFFIPLRNKIEHRSLPELDSSIFGECQAMLLNFDEALEREFGPKYCIRQCLSFALQIYPSSENLAEAVWRNRSVRSAAEFIEQYRSSISPDVLQSGRYSFKAFLIQVANHQSRDALAIQFRQYDKLSDEEKENVDRFVALHKYKQPTIANADTIRAGEVAKRVQKGLGDPKVSRGGKKVDKFNTTWHTRCWQQFKVRPPSNSEHPEQTEVKYCIYDKRHNDYGYTEEWVKFLINEFKDGKAYDRMFPRVVETRL